MLKNKTPKFWLLKMGICLGLVGLLGVLLFTRFGVFLVFDVAGDIRGTDNFTTEYLDAPVNITRVLADPQEVILPKHIEQVSGIVAQDGRFALSTDQAELFFLSDEGAHGGALFPFTPLLLRQGSIETVTQVEDEFWLTGENGAFLRVDQSGEIIGSHPLPDMLTTTDLTGLAWGDGTMYVTSDDTMHVSAVDVDTGNLRRLTLDFADVSEVPVADLTFLWSGVAYDAGQLYLIAENYPLVVVAEASSGRVTETIGIEGIHEFSDISLFDGHIVLPSDHNYFDARPPLLIYQISGS